MKKLFYFAYGSNMLLSRIERRLQDVIHAGTYTLADYRLVFNCGMNGNSFANIERSVGDSVSGVLYELTDRQIDTLDMYEGCYVRRYFVLPNGHVAYAYVSVNPRYFSRRLPSKDYINTLIEGAFENNLLETYNSLVDYKTNVMKLRSKHKLIKL